MSKSKRANTHYDPPLSGIQAYFSDPGQARAAERERYRKWVKAEKARERRERESTRTNPAHSKLVTLAYIGDGYLAAAEYGMHDEPYFLQLEGEEGFELEHVQLPEDIAEKVVAQGTQEQWYSDGYDAANAVAPFLRETNAMPTLEGSGRDLMHLLDDQGYMSLDSEMVDDVFLIAFVIPDRRRTSKVHRDVQDAVNVVNFSLRPSNQIQAKSRIRTAASRVVYVEVKRRKRR